MSRLYVATNGKDSSPGTFALPLRSLEAALEKAQPNDTVTVRGGTYKILEDLWVRTPRLTIEGAEGEAVRLVGELDGPEVVLRIDVGAGQFYALKTESTVDTGAAVEAGPLGLVVRRCKLHDTGADCVKLTPLTSRCTIEDCEIYNSGLRESDNAEGIDAVRADWLSIVRCHVHHTTTNGVYVKGGSHQTLIAACRVHDCGHSGILLGQHTDENWFAKDNPELYESIDGLVRNCMVWNCKGAGIGSWAALRPRIINNTLVNVAQTMFAGLLVQGQEHWFGTKDPMQPRIVPSKDVTMVNNIVVTLGTTRPVVEIREEGLVGHLYISHNVYWQGGKAGLAYFRDLIPSAGGVMNFAEWQAKGRDAQSLEADPLLDPGMRLLVGSPAINRGLTQTEVTDDFDGVPRPAGQFDVGADQRTGVVAPPAGPDVPVGPPEPKGGVYTSAAALTTLRLAVTLGQINKSPLLGLASGEVLALKDAAVVVRFNSVGRIDVRSGSGWLRGEGVQYRAGVVIMLTLEVDMATRTFSVYADGQVVASNALFNAAQAEVPGLSVFFTMVPAGATMSARRLDSPTLRL
jgi:hypothetical protein